MIRLARPFACLCLVAGCSSGCNPEVSFDVAIDGETTVERGSLLEQLAGSLGFASFVTFDISQTQEFANNDVRKDQVTSTRLTQLTLAVTAPDGATIDFIEEIAFLAEAPGVERTTVATEQVAEGATSFDCDLVDVDLAPYVRAESMSLTTDVTGRRPDVDTTIAVTAVFAVTAQVIGDD